MRDIAYRRVHIVESSRKKVYEDLVARGIFAPVRYARSITIKNLKNYSYRNDHYQSRQKLTLIKRKEFVVVAGYNPVEIQDWHSIYEVLTP